MPFAHLPDATLRARIDLTLKTTALAGGVLVLSSGASFAACVAGGPSGGFANSVNCTGGNPFFHTSTTDFLINLPDGNNRIRSGTADVVSLTENNNGLIIGDGARVRQNSTTSGNEAVSVIGSTNSEITVKSGGLIRNVGTSNAAMGIYARTGSHNLKVTIEDGGRIVTSGGEAIATSFAATSPTAGAINMLITNHGSIRHTKTTGDRLIHVAEATIINETTGTMQLDVSNRPVVEMENGGTLTNRGLIRNRGTGRAIDGDSTGPGVEYITNAGTIRTRGTTAISMFSSNDTLELQPGSVIIGNVDAGAGTDRLRFGGTGSDSFDLSEIGDALKYRFFETFEVIDGDWTFSGTTTDDFTVTGGRVLGTGTFADLTFTGGIFAPGNSAIGTTTVAGDLILGAGSTYEVDVNAAAQSDTIAVGGSTTVDTGATLAIQGAIESYPTTSLTSTILTSTGGVTGTFGTVTDNLPDVDFIVDYRSNDIRLIYSKVPETVAETVSTPSPTRSSTPGTPFSAKDIHAAGIAGASGADGAFIGTILQSPTTNRQNVGPNQRLSFRNLPDTASVSTRGATARHIAVWTAGIGRKIDVDGTATALGWDATTGGLTLGLDAAPDTATPMIATVALGYTSTRTTSGLATSQAKTAHLGLANTWHSGPWQFGAALSYGRTTYENERQFMAGGAMRTAKGKTSGQSLGVNLKSYYDLAAANGSTSEAYSYGPVFALDWLRTKTDGYTETGAGILNLDVASTQTTRAAARLGFAGSVSKRVNNAKVTFDGLLAIERHFGDRSVESVSTLPLTGQRFTTRSAPIDLHNAVVGLGATIELSAQTSAFAQYEGHLGRNASDHRLAIGLSIDF